MTDPIDPEAFYPPGSMFLARIQGRTGWWVGTAQALLGMPSEWTHAGIVGPEGTTFEAAPGGVYVGHVDDLQGRPHIVCDAPVQEALAAATHLDAAGKAALEKALRKVIVEQALLLVGTPYSFLDYLALALHHLAPRSRVTARVRKRVEDSKHLICSAYCDRVMDLAADYFSGPVADALHLYKDKRLSGDVTPSDLNAWFDDHNHIVGRVKA